MRRTKRSLALVALTVTALVTSLALVASPAAAHTLNDAARASAGCGWSSGSYSILDSRAIVGPDNVRWGTIYLLWHGGRGENCVVTLKSSATHGVATTTAATLRLLDVGVFSDIGEYAHYAAVARSARGICVRFSGYIRHPSGGIVSAGRAAFDNCG